MSKLVCLDPGHGIESSGKRSPDGAYFEHEFALDMAFRIGALLTGHGIQVLMTRENEHNVTLANRVKIANGFKNLDLFVSLHSNAAGRGDEWKSARGLVVYAYALAGKSYNAAKVIMDQQAKAGVSVRNGGKPVDGGHLYVVKNTTAPAVLIEHLFHDNREDVALLLDKEYRQKMAEADTKGILEYLNIKWKEEYHDMTKAEVQELLTQEVEELRKELREEFAPRIYHTLDEVPEWGKDTVAALMKSGRLKGDENGDLRLNYDLLRALVVQEREPEV